MAALLPYLVLFAGFAVVLAAFTALARYVRRRGTAGSGVSGALAAYDEAFRVTAHESHHEIQAQTRRKAPLPLPDGPGRPYAGAVGRGAGGDRGPAARRPRTRTRGARTELRRLAGRLLRRAR